MKRVFAPFILWYLKFFAKLQLIKIKPLIIGVGGSSGKSSVSLLISQILSQKFSVLQSKEKNSETGIPLNILDINIDDYSWFSWIKVVLLTPWRLLTNFKKYDIYVVEMGIDSPFPPKNMSYLLGIVKPQIGILTSIDLEHSQYFEFLAKSEKDTDRKKEIIAATAKEEGLLLKSLGESDRGIINLDDPNISNLLPLKSKTITVSSKRKDADFYISKINTELDSFEVDFIFLNENYKIKIMQPLPEYFAHSFILSIAACFSCGINIKDCITNLINNFSIPAGRFSVFKGIKNSVILDSSYNSSLKSAKGAIEVVSRIARTRKVGILGDMRELGGLSGIQHEELARIILKNLDYAILIGPEMKKFVAPILSEGNFNYEAFDTFSGIKLTLPERIKKGDTILVKGSQNTLFLERAVEILLEKKIDAGKLCRRGEFWDKKRKESA